MLQRVNNSRVQMTSARELEVKAQPGLSISVSSSSLSILFLVFHGL